MRLRRSFGVVKERDMTDQELPPPVWVGHIVVKATDVRASTEFYLGIGMREVVANDEFAVLELRGGTHLVVQSGAPDTAADFDLMVDEIDAVHSAWTAAGYEPGEIERGRIHDRFELLDPAGTKVTVNSSHVIGVV